MKTKKLQLLAGLLLLLPASLALSQSASDPHDPDATPAVNCEDCHTLHGKLIARGSAQETVCIGCHNPTGQASSLDNDFALHVNTAGGSTAIDCGSCHEVHGAMTASGETVANKWLIRSDPDKYITGALTSLVYTSTSTYKKSSSPYNGVCQACHTKTKYYTNSASSMHKMSQNCTNCHLHGRGFVPGCTSCHNTTQPSTNPTRRAVVNEFSYTNGTSHLTSAQLDEDDCEVCHDQTDHKAGDVVLTVYETANTATLTGDPNDTSSQATKLETFCLGCHTDNANLTDPTPFSTTSTPEDIDTDWSSTSSHNSASNPVITCYGDGTFGCHQSGHGSKNPSMISVYDTTHTDTVSEELCYTCHDGNPASTDIKTEMGKATAHDAAGYDGKHKAGETPDGKRTHIECMDCHNPHRADDTAASGGGLPGPLLGVSGFSSAKKALTTASKEYEICYKCHADTNDSNSNRITRDVDEASILDRFDTTNPSFHPLEAAGKNADVPSLKTGWTTTSTVQCTDCHNNDSATGPNGPHGSQWDFILKKRYETADNTQESAAVYALCYDCHDRTSILNDESFGDHDKHITGEDTSCATCHAPHGVAGGSTTNNSHLINFDTSIVTTNSNGDLFFKDNGKFAGTCSLKCHGKDHDDKDYK